MADPEDDALPVKLPALPPQAPRFGPVAVDYVLNTKLQDLIPKEAKKATVSIRVKGLDGGQEILTGVVAVKTGKVWKVDLGAALGGAVDLHNHHNFEAEFLGVLSWE